nr:unnamed protein product [Digitaria exilis]
MWNSAECSRFWQRGRDGFGVGDRKGAIPSPSRTSLKEMPGGLEPIGGSEAPATRLPVAVEGTRNFQIALSYGPCSEDGTGRRRDGEEGIVWGMQAE